MRRILSLASLVLLGFGLGGCHPCIHGVCDCYHPDPCCTRAPWAMPTPPPPIANPVNGTPVPGGAVEELPPAKKL
jgi:hypothetical protein